MQTHAISVVIVDTNPTFLRIARRWLHNQQHEHLTVAATIQSFDESIAQVRQLQPDVILLGIGQYSMEGLRLIPHMRLVHPESVIIVLGTLNLEAYRHAAMRAGADGFVAKVAMHHDLLATMQQSLGLLLA